jgi:hypothetical protein
MAFYSMLQSNQEENLTSSFRGFHNIHAHVMVFVQNEMENVQQHWKLPFIIGTEEFARDSECGLAGIKKWFLVLFHEPVFGSTPELKIVDGSCSHVTAFGFADV